MTKVNAAIIYYSATGSVYALAKAAAESAEKAGASVRLLKVQELAPQEAIDTNAGWSKHALETQDLPEASNADLEWADVVLLGSPTRYGLPTAQLKQFLDQTGPLWGAGKLSTRWRRASRVPAPPTAVRNRRFSLSTTRFITGVRSSSLRGTPIQSSFRPETPTVRATSRTTEPLLPVT